MCIYSKSNPPSGFYVYAYLRSDGTPYYIGKGKGTRAWSKIHSVNLPNNKENIVILEQNLTEKNAFLVEMHHISLYGRKDVGTGILRNRTNGGDGPSGKMISEETRQKMSRPPWNKGLKGAQVGPNLGKSSPLKGSTISEEHRFSIAVGSTGHKKATVCCPHCSLVGGRGNMMRYHFNNCKSISQ
jgi:hypothetical protein